MESHKAMLQATAPAGTTRLQHCKIATFRRNIPAEWPSIRPMPRRKRKGGAPGVKRKGSQERRRRLEQKEHNEASESASASASSATTTTSPPAASRKTKCPPRAEQRQALKDPPVGEEVTAAASRGSEIVRQLVELFQNPAWKERLMEFLSEEPSDGELKPPPMSRTEGLNPVAAMAAAMEASADRLLKGLDGLDRSPETTDVATQTDQPTLALVPELASRRQKIRDMELNLVDKKEFRFKRCVSICKAHDTHGWSGSAIRARNWTSSQTVETLAENRFRRQNKWLMH